MKFKKGDTVKMINCGEAEHYKDKVLICRTDSFNPEHYPKEEVCFLEGFAGWFLCKFLEKADKECEHDFTYFKHKIGRCSLCGATTEPLSEFEPDEDYEEESQCNVCGLTDDHSIECPNNNSPFAELIRNGYD